MSLLAHYDAMRNAALAKLALGVAEADPLLDDPTDTRRGITLLTRPPAAVVASITEVMSAFQALEPAQYFYPASDLHLTILSLISCYSGFTMADIDPAAYRALVAEVLRSARPFRVVLRGLTASPGGILLQGFPEGEGLEAVRRALRQAFRASGLQQSIDQRYSIQTAHSTIVRFRAPLRQPLHVVDFIRRYEHHFFGEFEVNTMELVFNDWYQRAAHTELLACYHLPT